MNILIVTAHPLQDSLTAHLATHLRDSLSGAGHAVRLADLYADGFDPVLTAAERRGYDSGTAGDPAGLAGVQALVLVFPTWWAGLPAMMKGWIDRSFLPGAAFEVTDTGALRPRLTGLRHVLVVTTQGGPWWIDRLVLRRPLARVLRWNVFRPCAPRARFRMVALYDAVTVTPDRLARFRARLDRITATFSQDRT